MISVAVLGVSHWHLNLYLDPLRRIDDVRIVGVSDPRPEIARGIGQDLQCPWSTSSEEICHRSRPDFVFALGRHADMAETARFLIEEKIPFAMEKPCGLNLGEVRELDRLARVQGAFAAIPFVWRNSELLHHLRARIDDSAIDYLSLRWIAGPPSRYIRSGCDWMLDPAQSGGGCTINLSVHLIDLVRVIFGSSVELTAAVLSNRAYGLPIEDHSMLALRQGSRTALIETGYLYPAGHSTFDMRFSIKAKDSYAIATGPQTIEFSGPGERREIVKAWTTNVPHYPVFVADVLDRFKRGKWPLASMVEMAAALEIVDAAYQSSYPVPPPSLIPDRQESPT